MASWTNGSAEKVEDEDEEREVTEDYGVDAAPGSEDRRRFVVRGAGCVIGRPVHNVFPALNKFAKMRNAPGTPAGNSRNQESAVNT